MYLYNGMPAVNFEASLDEDGKISSASAAVTIHKRNGKVKGSYRFDVNKSKGLRANYYTRKGKKIELMNNQPLLENAKKLLASRISDDEMIVSDFANATECSLNNNVTDRVINFDYSDFSLEAIDEAVEKVRSAVGNISGEIPLKGLNERISYYTDIMKKEKQSSNQKVLKLTDNT